MISVANNTAPKHESVWKGLNEVTFRNVISALAVASKDLPGDSRNYSVQDWERHHPVHGDSQRSLSLEDEQRLADDFAFIAAFREGGISVSAVGLEERLHPPGLTVRLAANRLIPEQVPRQLNAILEMLRARAARGGHITSTQ